jgi:hypothetical protein
MSILKRPCTGAIAVAALCLCGQVADAQVAPVQYWLPSGLFGFGSGWTNANSSNTYGNFPGFDAQPGDGDWRANFRTGMFVRSDAGSVGLNGLGRAGALSDFGALSYQSAVTGYNFKGAGDLPVTLYAGFDTLKYRPGLGSPLAPFSTDASVAAGYSARAGIAFRPTPNISLSFEAGFTQQQSGGIDGRP